MHTNGSNIRHNTVVCWKWIRSANCTTLVYSTKITHENSNLTKCFDQNTCSACRTLGASNARTWNCNGSREMLSINIRFDVCTAEQSQLWWHEIMWEEAQFIIIVHIRHRGLPPWRGGGAYAPRTWRICNLEERSQLRANHVVRTTILHVTSAKRLVNFRLHSQLLRPLVTSGVVHWAKLIQP